MATKPASVEKPRISSREKYREHYQPDVQAFASADGKRDVSGIIICASIGIVAVSAFVVWVLLTVPHPHK